MQELVQTFLGKVSANWLHEL